MDRELESGSPLTTYLQELSLIPEFIFDHVAHFFDGLKKGKRLRSSHSFTGLFYQAVEYVYLIVEVIFDYANLVRKEVNELCLGLEPWQVAAYTFGATCLALWIHSMFQSDKPLYERIKKAIFHYARRIPFVKQKIAKELAKARRDIEITIHSVDKKREFYRFLPDKGMPEDELMEEAALYHSMGNYDVKGGHVSGTVYGGEEEMTGILTKVYSMFAFSNPLHPDVFPGCRKMEAEVVRMVANLYHGPPESCGTMTSGGTESLLLVCMAYRNRAYDMGITEPEMVIPITAHAAFDKAGHLFGIKVIHVPIDKTTLKANVWAMKRNISANTCMLVGSAPGFPHGIIDPIEEISRLGQRYKIPVHVDCCLGGFILPFMEQCSFSLPSYDYRLPGVTSISCDTHKYAFTPKGSSVITYRNEELRHFQYFCQPDWPGGIYASPTLAGSRCGANIATCWATLLSFGKQGYLDSTKKIIDTTRFIANGIDSIEGLEVMGEPEVSVVAFTSSLFNIYSLSDQMGKKGWNLNALQFPSGIHIAVTSFHTKPGVAEKFVEDLNACTLQLIKEPVNPNDGKAAIYGMAQSIPDRSLVTEMAFTFLDTCYSTVAPNWRKGSADLTDTSHGRL